MGLSLFSFKRSKYLGSKSSFHDLKTVIIAEGKFLFASFAFSQLQFGPFSKLPRCSGVAAFEGYPRSCSSPGKSSCTNKSSAQSSLSPNYYFKVWKEKRLHSLITDYSHVLYWTLFRQLLMAFPLT